MPGVTEEVKTVWKKFRRMTADHAALVLKLDGEDTICLDGDIHECTPEVSLATTLLTTFMVFDSLLYLGSFLHTGFNNVIPTGSR